MQIQIDIPKKRIEEFCQRWKVAEFALFGSILSAGFRPDSDIDVLVSFFPGARWSLLDMVGMQDESEEILGRRVDLVEKEGLRNPFRRHSILNSKEVIYAA